MTRPSDHSARSDTSASSRLHAPILSETLPPPPAVMPRFETEIAPPDLTPWRKGNCGIPGVHHFRAGLPGPHTAITALMHGNEFAGAMVLDELLRQGFQPQRGRLSLIFANLEAFDRFDPENPTVSRFVDEDMNRLWTPERLDTPRRSTELDRARALMPLLGTVDKLLDLHSMLWPADPLILSGATNNGQALARQIGTPPMIVRDHGHPDGRRLIDHPHFTAAESNASACLLEAGQHWSADAVDRTRAAVWRFLRSTGQAATVGRDPASLPDPVCATVTECVTALTSRFTFQRAFRSGEIITERGTLLARDGHDEIRTPYDDCMLVMPNLRAARGHTAVRLARIDA